MLGIVLRQKFIQSCRFKHCGHAQMSSFFPQVLNVLIKQSREDTDLQVCERARVLIASGRSKIEPPPFHNSLMSIIALPLEALEITQ